MKRTSENPIELDDRDLSSLERLEGQKRPKPDALVIASRVHECIKRLFSHPQSYGRQKIRYVGEAMMKYAVRSDYDRLAQQVNEQTHTIKDYRPYRHIDAAYRCAVLDDVSRYLSNEGFNMAIQTEKAAVTNDLDLELEIENAEKLCKQEEADVRSIEKTRRRDPFVNLIFKIENIKKRAVELTESADAMVTMHALREFLRILIDWIRKIVNDTISIEEQFRTGRSRVPQVRWKSVSVALSMHGFSDEMLERIRCSVYNIEFNEESLKGLGKSEYDEEEDFEGMESDDKEDLGGSDPETEGGLERSEPETEDGLERSEFGDEDSAYDDSELESVSDSKTANTSEIRGFVKDFEGEFNAKGMIEYSESDSDIFRTDSDAEEDEDEGESEDEGEGEGRKRSSPGSSLSCPSSDSEFVVDEDFIEA